MAKKKEPESADQAQEADQPESADQAEAVDQAEGVEVNEAALPEVDGSDAKVGRGQIDILLDTPVPVEVRLGEAELPVGELLKLGEGAVVKLDKRVGEPVDLYIRGVKFATGQLVVVGEQLGVRIREILSASVPDQSAEPAAADA